MHYYWTLLWCKHNEIRKNKQKTLKSLKSLGSNFSLLLVTFFCLTHPLFMFGTWHFTHLWDVLYLLLIVFLFSSHHSMIEKVDNFREIFSLSSAQWLLWHTKKFLLIDIKSGIIFYQQHTSPRAFRNFLIVFSLSL